MSESPKKQGSSSLYVPEGASAMVVEENDGGSGALDFSSLVPLCTARKAFNSQVCVFIHYFASLLCFFMPCLPVVVFRTPEYSRIAYLYSRIVGPDHGGESNQLANDYEP